VVVTIDIGNTNVTIGLYDGDKLKTTWRLSSVGPKTTDECRLFLRDSFVSAGLNPKAIKGSILCSVVPRLTPAVKQALEQLTDVRALVVGQDRADDPLAGSRIAAEGVQESGMDREGARGGVDPGGR